ncbi:MAG: type II secretion system minor pseudopilin GspK [Sphingorhabdus sp.]
MMPRRFEIPPAERGAALLSILLLVAILSVVAATTLDRVTLSTQLAQNGQAARQARLLSYAAEDLALARIADLRAANATQTTLAGGWLGQPQTFQLPGGQIAVTATDGGNCFNLNSLVKSENGALAANPIGRDQFVSLMVALAVPENVARQVADSATDWADSDTSPLPAGAEDGAYQTQATPYVAPNQLFADKSELRAVAGVAPALYARLEPLICALPVAELSPLNVNTLLPEQSALLAMLYPPGAITRNSLQAHLAKRPASGYGSLVKFWEGLTEGASAPPQAVQDQVKLVTNWFRLDIGIESGDIRLRETALISAEQAPPHLLWRSWAALP